MEEAMEESVGFVGLGVMGRPMAENLSKSLSVVGFDIEASRFEGLPRLKRAESVGAVGSQCGVVCLSLPNAAVVESVVLAPDGLAASLKRGSVLVDLSTNLPSVSRRIAARLAERGIEFADAPVSGGEAGARSASLAVMVGSSKETFKRVAPILSLVGKSVIRVGEVGAGGTAKLVNNMIVAAAFAVIAEGFALAEKNGLALGELYEAIKSGWAGSKVLDVSAAAIGAGDYTPGGTIDMMEKDLSYARLLAAEGSVPIPISALAHEVFVAGKAAGRGAFSQPAIIELWRRLGGERPTEAAH